MFGDKKKKKANKAVDCKKSKAKDTKSKKQTAVPKKDLKGAPSAKAPEKAKPAAKASRAPKAPKAEKIMHDDKYERGTEVEKPIIIKSSNPKGAKVKELRRAAKVGGYTVFDGPRTGKTFETPKEAKEYAMELLKRTGVVYKIEKMDRQVTHTYRAENKAGK